MLDLVGLSDHPGVASSASKPTRQEKLLLLRKNETRSFSRETVVIRHLSVKSLKNYVSAVRGWGARLLALVKRSYRKFRGIV